jgi:hypothetical protein
MAYTLNGGDRLNPGQSITSSNGRYVFIYQGDGNLVLYINGGIPLWDAKTTGKPLGFCIMQGDGNLVLYGGGQPLWDTHTGNKPGSRLIVQDDGNLVIYAPNNVPVWNTGTGVPQFPSAQGDDMQPGEALYPNESIWSANGRYRFIYQADGNLVLYGPSGALWNSQTGGKTPGVCVMQGDGNLVIYGPRAVVIWNSQTHGNPGSRLIMQNDGNSVIYRPNNVPIWNTKTTAPVRTYNLVVFGDSIMWGQGLKESHKFHTLVQNEIQKIYDNTVVKKEMFAHSGAIIGVGDIGVHEAKPREIPFSYPTILQQVESYPLQKAQDVDLVLVDGGINDLGIFNILFDKSSENLKNRTSYTFGNDLKILLRAVLEKFSSSRTRIMVIGYYPIVSKWSDVGILRSVGAKIGGLVGSTGVGLVATAFATVAAVLAGTILDETLKNIAVANCKVFYDTSVSLSNQVIQELDPSHLKINYYSYDLFESYAIFTSASTLWGKQPFLSTPYSDDEARAVRKMQCNSESLGLFDRFKCEEAGIGHPNIDGAIHYARGILGTLFPTPLPCRSYIKEIETLELKLRRLQEEYKQKRVGSGDRVELKEQILQMGRELSKLRAAFTKCKHDYYNGEENFFKY